MFPFQYLGRGYLRRWGLERWEVSSDNSPMSGVDLKRGELKFFRMGGEIADFCRNDFKDIKVNAISIGFCILLTSVIVKALLKLTLQVVLKEHSE